MVSDIDIKDWDRGPVTKIQDIPVGSYVEDPWSGQALKYMSTEFGKAWLSNTEDATFFFELTAEFIPLFRKDDETLKEKV